MCLAARGAWALWNDNTTIFETDQYTGLIIEVTYGEDTISSIHVDVDARGSNYTGRSVKGLSLSQRTFDSLRRRDVGHWIRAVLNELAFGDMQPLPQVTRGSAPRELPTCWRKGNESRIDGVLALFQECSPF